MLATKIATSLMAAVATVAGCATDTPDGPSGGALSAREAADLAWMREEEKLARDVYDALDGYGQPFANVQTSEQRHFDAVGGLLGWLPAMAWLWWRQEGQFATQRGSSTTVPPQPAKQPR